MNWCAAQIGIADESRRIRFIALGERLGLYRDYPVSKGCTWPYLPIWIGSVVGKKRRAQCLVDEQKPLTVLFGVVGQRAVGRENEQTVVIDPLDPDSGQLRSVPGL